MGALARQSGPCKSGVRRLTNRYWRAAMQVCWAWVSVSLGWPSTFGPNSASPSWGRLCQQRPSCPQQGLGLSLEDRASSDGRGKRPKVNSSAERRRVRKKQRGRQLRRPPAILALHMSRSITRGAGRTGHRSIGPHLMSRGIAGCACRAGYGTIALKRVAGRKAGRTATKTSSRSARMRRRCHGDQRSRDYEHFLHLSHPWFSLIPPPRDSAAVPDREKVEAGGRVQNKSLRCPITEIGTHQSSTGDAGQARTTPNPDAVLIGTTLDLKLGHRFTFDIARTKNIGKTRQCRGWRRHFIPEVLSPAEGPLSKSSGPLLGQERSCDCRVFPMPFPKGNPELAPTPSSPIEFWGHFDAKGLSSRPLPGAGAFCANAGYACCPIASSTVPMQVVLT
ncbi:hypothetical protein FBZ94_10884 [Bradyrhizobium sacchari]|uniref:Uncharacterized protein n=1 Tax=Bradyrhizobium sacchari TaxID=1399419 RepID=A0A560K4Q0_9BRAD|nr:hypothetical protein FBZ94_10884 [Bradyrhizobium sacchari]TWB78252.1 hypothetical protein FBZ95_10384 [Bradyrhizobium sacchari]